MTLARRVHLHEFGSQCADIAKAKDVQICMVGYCKLTREEEEGGALENFELFIMNKLRGSTEFDLRNRRVNFDIV